MEKSESIKTETGQGPGAESNPAAGTGPGAKTENKGSLLKISLLIFAVVALIYGLAYVFIPGVMVKLSGGDPVDAGWLRWSGAVLVALGIGAILVFRKPEGQDIFVITVASGSLFSGLALLYSWIHDKQDFINIGDYFILIFFDFRNIKIGFQ